MEDTDASLARGRYLETVNFSSSVIDIKTLEGVLAAFQLFCFLSVVARANTLRSEWYEVKQLLEHFF
jgi:hypothetical protein